MADQTLSERLGQLIRERRELEDLSQSKLAGLLGVSQPTVSGWERGDCIPTLRAVLGLARVLGIRMHDLAALLDEPNGEAA